MDIIKPGLFGKSVAENAKTYKTMSEILKKHIEVAK